MRSWRKNGIRCYTHKPAKTPCRKVRHVRLVPPFQSASLDNRHLAVRPDVIGWSADALSGLRGLKRKSGQKEASPLGRLLHQQWKGLQRVNRRRHVLAATTKKSSESLRSSSSRFRQRAQRQLNGAPVHTCQAFLRCTCLTKSTRLGSGRSLDSFDFGRTVCLQPLMSRIGG
jgi:hypothetical protein